MNISVRMEGGLGDHILSNRFIPAILDKHPGADIHLFSDTNGKTLQSDVLMSLYNHFKSRTLIYRKSEKYKIKTQFGEENFPSHLNNIRNSDRALMNDCDKFYNLHIDWMEWLDFDFDWQRYFYHFPQPHIEIHPIKFNKPHIVLHVASDNLANNHRMKKGYLQKLLHDIPPAYDVIVLSTPSTDKFVQSIFKDEKRAIIFNKSIQDVIRLVKGCSGLIAIDSGVKYFGYVFNKPTITWAKESNRAHSCLPAFQMRWLTFPSLIMPLEHDSEYIVNCILNLINSNNLFLAPHLTMPEINKALIRRKVDK